LARILRPLGKFLKWLLVAAVALEVFSFLVVTGSNLFIYATVWESSRANYDAYTLFLEDEGPRPTLNNPPTAAGKNHLTLWLFGGSTMRGSTPDHGKTIPSLLAEILNRGQVPTSYTVLNFGENSFNSLLESKYLQKLLIESPNPPDLIIFYDGANDCSYFAQYRTPYGHHGYRRVQALVESYRRSLFGLLKPFNAALNASFTRELYDKLMATMAPLSPDSELLRQMAELTERRYEHLRKLAACYGARFLVVWQPILWVETRQLALQVRDQEQRLPIFLDRFTAVRRNFTVTYQTLAQRLQDKPYFINFQNVLCSRTEPVYQRDGVHLNDQGRQLIAQRLGEVLKERGFGK
jgi:lysophospholipase L1-like esterase